MKRFSVKLVVPLAVLALAGCSTTPAPDSTARQIVGTWGSKTEGEPFLTFGESGKVLGNDGCNVLNASWKEAGGTITLGDMAMSLMACPGVDSWLNMAATAKIDGNNLHLFDANGKKIGQLPGGAENN